MSDTTIPSTESDKEESWGFSEEKPFSVVLAAYVPDQSVLVDRCVIEKQMVIGRGEECDFSIWDHRLSKRHAVIRVGEDGAWIEDLGSTNGTFVQGELLEGRRKLMDGAVIRAGSSILVYHDDAQPLMLAAVADSHGFVGPFYITALLRDLKEAAASMRHILITGPTGSGKELAAGAVAGMLGKKVRVHNAARFASEEEAMSTLFGVGHRVFSNVDSRPGLIEQARDNLLFIDEIQHLPERVQYGLLRIVEEAEYERIGDSGPSKINLRFIFASNAPEPYHGLAKDLHARLLKVSLPGLDERIADIPALFKHLVCQAGVRYGVDVGRLCERLSTDHYEALCLGDYGDSNVRGLLDIADRLVVRFRASGEEEPSIRKIFRDHFGNSAVALRTDLSFRVSKPVFSAVAARDLDATDMEDRATLKSEERLRILRKVYQEVGGNVAAIKRVMHTEGVNASRKWISSALDDLGLVRIRKG